jgi:hypothetical protein
MRASFVLQELVRCVPLHASRSVAISGKRMRCPALRRCSSSVYAFITVSPGYSDDRITWLVWSTLDQIIIPEAEVTHLKISSRSLKLLKLWKLVFDLMSQMQCTDFYQTPLWFLRVKITHCIHDPVAFYKYFENISNFMGGGHEVA